jgi:hypothetical protein
VVSGSDAKDDHEYRTGILEVLDRESTTDDIELLVV